MTRPTDLLNQFLGAAGGAAAPGQPAGGAGQAGGFSLDSLMNQKGGLAAGLAAGGLAGLLLGGKKPKKLAKGALKVGGAALVGGLAYKAWRDWQANKQAPAPQPQNTAQPTAAPPALPDASGTPFLPETAAEQDDLSRALIRAMIAAAKADGHVTADEEARIRDQLTALPLDDDDRRFITEELARPLDPNAVAEAAKTPEQAAEMYAASLLAIDTDGAAEKAYLALLAARLGLEPGLVDHLHANAAAVTAAV